MLDIPLVQSPSKSDRSETARISKNEIPSDAAEKQGSDFDTAYAENSDNRTVEVTEETTSSDSDDGETGDTLDSTVDETVGDEDQILTSGDGFEGNTDEPELVVVSSETKTAPRLTSVATSELAFSQQLTTNGAKEHQLLAQSGSNALVEVDMSSFPTSNTSQIGAEIASPTGAIEHSKKGLGDNPTGDLAKLQLQQAHKQEGISVATGIALKAGANDSSVGAKNDPTRVAAVILPEAMQQAAGAPRREAKDLPLRVGPGQDETTGAANTTQTTPTIAASTMTLSQMKVTNFQSSEGFELQSIANQEIESTMHWETRSSSTATTVPATARPETAGLIGRQMAQALQRLPDRPVELSLNPQELGRVRLSISASDAGITVSVLAERPETLDLMRRNIDQLAIEFQSMGYQNINFAFADGQAEKYSESGSDGSESGSQSDQADHQEVDAPIEQLSLGPATGVDIRL